MGQIAKPHGGRITATDRFGRLLCVLTISLLRQSAAYASSAQSFLSVRERFLTLLADCQSSLSMTDGASCSVLSVARRFERAVCSTNPGRDSRKTYLVMALRRILRVTGRTEATLLSYPAIACFLLVLWEVLSDLEAIGDKCADLRIALWILGAPWVYAVGEEVPRICDRPNVDWERRVAQRGELEAHPSLTVLIAVEPRRHRASSVEYHDQL